MTHSLTSPYQRYQQEILEDPDLSNIEFRKRFLTMVSLHHFSENQPAQKDEIMDLILKVSEKGWAQKTEDEKGEYLAMALIVGNKLSKKKSPLFTSSELIRMLKKADLNIFDTEHGNTLAMWLVLFNSSQKLNFITKEQLKPFIGNYHHQNTFGQNILSLITKHNTSAGLYFDYDEYLDMFNQTDITQINTQGRNIGQVILSTNEEQLKFNNHQIFHLLSQCHLSFVCEDWPQPSLMISIIQCNKSHGLYLNSEQLMSLINKADLTLFDAEGMNSAMYLASSNKKQELNLSPSQVMQVFKKAGYDKVDAAGYGMAHYIAYYNRNLELTPEHIMEVVRNSDSAQVTNEQITLPMMIVKHNKSNQLNLISEYIQEIFERSGNLEKEDNRGHTIAHYLIEFNKKQNIGLNFEQFKACVKTEHEESRNSLLITFFFMHCQTEPLSHLDGIDILNHQEICLEIMKSLELDPDGMHSLFESLKLKQTAAQINKTRTL